MSKFLIIEIRGGTHHIIELNTKRKKFLDIIAEAKEYIELTKKQKDKFKRLLKTQSWKI